MAVIWGTPIPAITRVVQIEPGPIPTFIIEAPASIRSRVPSAVATFPAMMVRSGYCSLIRLTVLRILIWCPCAESSTTTSTPALTSAAVRSITSLETPTAAPTSNRPCASFAEFGNWMAFSMSLIVIKPFSSLCSSTKGSFSILCCWRITSACSNVVPTGAVTKLSWVMTSLIWIEKSWTNRRSRLVKIPTNLFCSFTIGTPEIRYLAISASAS